MTIGRDFDIPTLFILKKYLLESIQIESKFSLEGQALEKVE